MSPFEQHLISVGFKRYRKSYEKKNWVYTPSNDGYSFSSMVSGELDYRYLHGDKEVIFGLSEKDKPPTLCWPRPKGVVSDDAMNRILKENNPEKVYKMIYN